MQIYWHKYVFHLSFLFPSTPSQYEMLFAFMSLIFQYYVWVYCVHRCVFCSLKFAYFLCVQQQQKYGQRMPAHWDSAAGANACASADMPIVSGGMVMYYLNAIFMNHGIFFSQSKNVNCWSLKKYISLLIKKMILSFKLGHSVVQMFSFCI